MYTQKQTALAVYTLRLLCTTYTHIHTYSIPAWSGRMTSSLPLFPKSQLTT